MSSDHASTAFVCACGERHAAAFADSKLARKLVTLTTWVNTLVFVPLFCARAAIILGCRHWLARGIDRLPTVVYACSERRSVVPNRRCVATVARHRGPGLNLCVARPSSTRVRRDHHAPGFGLDEVMLFFIPLAFITLESRQFNASGFTIGMRTMSTPRYITALQTAPLAGRTTTGM
jgi:hypothetical protein